MKTKLKNLKDVEKSPNAGEFCASITSYIGQTSDDGIVTSSPWRMNKRLLEKDASDENGTK